MKLKLSGNAVYKSDVALEISETLGSRELVAALCEGKDGSQIEVMDSVPATLYRNHSRECLVAMWRGAVLRSVRSVIYQAAIHSGERYQRRVAAVMDEMIWGGI